MSALEIEMFPCLSDNYAFLLHDEEASVIACVDTPDAAEIERALARKGCRRCRRHLRSSVPRTLSYGRRVLRSASLALRRTLGLERGPDVAVFARTRALKDAF